MVTLGEPLERRRNDETYERGIRVLREDPDGKCFARQLQGLSEELATVYLMRCTHGAKEGDFGIRGVMRNTINRYV